MHLKCVFLLCALLNPSLSSSSGFENPKEKGKKNKGRMSRVTWQLHENENNNLDQRLFEFENDDFSNEMRKKKTHYKKRKYNVKVQHKRKEMPAQNMTPAVSLREKMAARKETSNQVDRTMNKNKFEKIISMGTTDEKQTYKSVVPKMKEHIYYNRNNIETEDEGEKEKAKAKKKPSHLQRKPKMVYVKNKNEVSEIKEELKLQLVSKSEPPKIPQTKSKWDKISQNDLLPLMGLDANSLANPHKQKERHPKVHEDDKTSVADELAKKVRVLCWVLTHPDNHDSKCKPIKDTWGKRCNKLLFMSTEYDPDIPTVKLDVKEGRGSLWPKVKAAFRYVYDNYRGQFDWYVRADDDTYIVVENLRYLLADFNPQDPMYFGCRFKHFAPQGYMSGGAGIPLSSAALERLVPALDNDTDICKINVGWDEENDDVNLGVCLSRVGVRAMDSRDVAHKGRFLVFMPQDHVSPFKMPRDESYWYWKYVYYPTQTGAGCCSDYAISFHYVSPDDMYALDFLIYRVRPFGIQYGEGPLPSLLVNNSGTYKRTWSHKNRLMRRREQVKRTTVSQETSTYVRTDVLGHYKNEPQEPEITLYRYEPKETLTDIKRRIDLIKRKMKKQKIEPTTEIFSEGVRNEIYEQPKVTQAIKINTERSRGENEIIYTDAENDMRTVRSSVPSILYGN